MRKHFLLLLFIAQHVIAQQPLTIQKIMQDAKWIGTSPSDVFWSYNSDALYFKWNPEKAISDSAYIFKLNAKEPEKISYKDAALAKAINNGNYNQLHTKIVYTYQGDAYLLDIASNKTTRITFTQEEERDVSFCNHDEWIIYHAHDNVFAWNSKDGSTIQLTAFIHSSTPSSLAKKTDEEEAWVQNQQLQTSDVIKQRKNKRDARKAFLQSIKETDTLHKIYVGKKNIIDVQVSPDARFVTYNLYEAPEDVKNTIVPDYVTESGFTTDIPGREKVGAPKGKYAFYVFDRVKDTVLAVNTDSLPGITDQPDYVKDYPEKYKDKKAMPRDVYVTALFWNEDASACLTDIRSQDNKDRWLMLLNAATGKFTLADHQHDNAWIGGPGIGWEVSSTVGWVNKETFFYQSEVSGYSHLYTYNISKHERLALTKGNYEVQQLLLSKDKKYFYIVTNEDHPGKQNIYKINVDGTNKIKLTDMTGQYEMNISPDEKHLAYRYSYQIKPWELFVQDAADNKNKKQLTNKGASAEWTAYPWRDTKIFSFTNNDGQPVYARIYEPATGTKNNAAVIFVHGAGYLQNVDYGWSYYYHEMMFNNLLADKGYTVLDIDYRASAGYGRDWRTAIYRYMGGKDLDDEVDAAHYLVKQYGIDSTRIGMYGGSYGGFMTLMALFTKPNVFKAGAALRPVTDWAAYNDGYTGAILNEPFTDSLAYARSSPINFANGLKNYLLICHGMVDVNVHFQDVVRLTQRLIELGKDNWQIAPYPVEDHGFVEPSSWTDEYKRILKLFDENLLK
jgi:dipeptidyl aminopeptidase/acylaminoacyl peptidase